MTPASSAIHPVIILGAGPAGLSVAYELMQRGITPLVLEKGPTPGASFTAFPRNIFFGPWINNLLPGSFIRWTGLLKRSSQPDYANYLREYASRNHLPIKCGIEVFSVTRAGNDFRLLTSTGEYRSHLLINCTGYFARPYTPKFPGIETTRLSHMHVSQYRDANMVSDRLNRPFGRVLVVGKRLSSGETMVELHKAGHRVSLSYRGELRFGLPAWGTALLSPLDRIAERILVALRVRKHSYPHMAGGESRRLVKRGEVPTFPNIARFNEDSGTFEDGREEQFDLIIFATGYRPALTHLEDLLGPQPGEPVLDNMESAEVPGLFFLGMDQQRTYRSRFLRGIVEDSIILAGHVANRAEPLPSIRPEFHPHLAAVESSAPLLRAGEVAG